MAELTVGINGFGRIGRLVLRVLLKHPNVKVTKINDLTDTASLAHLFKYDSVHGVYPGEVRAEGSELIIDGVRILTTAQAEPAKLGWGELNTRLVVEATGRFTSRELAELHLQAGAEKVVISAPAKGEVDATLVLGVNDNLLNNSMQIVSNASCTTNCLAPMAKVLDEHCGLQQGFMNTIHAYTADQRLQDAPHKDLRRARAAAINIVPTTTGAAKAVGLVLPHLRGKLDGSATRVPVPDGSLTELTALVAQDTSAEKINAAMKAAAHGPLQGVLEYSEAPLVSSDIVGNPHSCIFDALSTSVMGKLVKIVGWYDNEWGYANRTAELVLKLGQ